MQSLIRCGGMYHTNRICAQYCAYAYISQTLEDSTSFSYLVSKLAPGPNRVLHVEHGEQWITQCAQYGNTGNCLDGLRIILSLVGSHHYITSNLGSCGCNSPLAEHTINLAICVQTDLVCGDSHQAGRRESYSKTRGTT